MSIVYLHILANNNIHAHIDWQYITLVLEKFYSRNYYVYFVLCNLRYLTYK